MIWSLFDAGTTNRVDRTCCLPPRLPGGTHTSNTPDTLAGVFAYEKRESRFAREPPASVARVSHFRTNTNIRAHERSMQTTVYLSKSRGVNAHRGAHLSPSGGPSGKQNTPPISRIIASIIYTSIHETLIILGLQIPEYKIAPVGCHKYLQCIHLLL